MRSYFRPIIFTSLIMIVLHSHILAEPAYAKWGRIAMQETSERYQSSIIDYLHIGHTQISDEISEERFKLWLEDSRRQFGVYVTIQFNSTTEELISIKFIETDR